MIGRLLYHGFWNFYDNLGLLVLAGAAYAIGAVGLLVIGSTYAGAYNVSPLIAYILTGVLELVLLVLSISALFPFCGRAARDEPARIGNMITGVKTHWKVFSKVVAVYSVLFVILAVNLSFYLQFQNHVSGSGFRLVVIVVTALIAWTSLILYLFGLPWLSAAGYKEESCNLKSSFRGALLAVALVPGLWILLGVLTLLLIVGGLYSRIGFIFVLPVIASLGQTAYNLAIQYSDFLATAKTELGADKPLRAYKKLALQRGLDWEARQPKRTFKELIRPWDY